jgi:hypothetical protein
MWVWRGHERQARKNVRMEIEMERAWDTERRENPYEAGVRRGRSEFGHWLRPDIRTLVFSYIF